MSLDRFSVVLFVPGDRPARFHKAATSGADAIIIDLEDAVAPSAKEEARASLETNLPDAPVLVRVNGEGTEWFADDIAAVAKLPLAGVMIPKAELSGDWIDFAATSDMPTVALIETACGLAQARQIAALPGVVRLAFGSIDFCADMGCAHTTAALAPARYELVIAARLAGIAAPIDGVTSSIEDTDLIASDARLAVDLGFTGKLAIHPRQIAPIRRGLQPNEAEVDWARHVLASGEGAAAVQGMMVDRPVRLRAQSILARAANPQQFA